MKIKLDEGAKMPTRAHDTDAGLDLYARETRIVEARERAFFDTGVHIELPPFTMGDIRSKSGLMKNHGITTDGTVDVVFRILEDAEKRIDALDAPTEKVCTGKRCPMQVGYDVKNCKDKDCIYRTEIEKGGVE